ncbi:peptidoglycan-binding domain-containing protein [Ostreiculturibacter nitratireducens]|uniref:peptidoglycan-binding domain-containing protein n=1 Tax=Ostreiculturibacter nitratireducens TaxID=3075226 RepID=UPI0031B64624
MIFRATLAIALVAAAGPAMADNRALILANADYRFAADIDGAEDALAADEPLKDAGFSVVVGADMSAEGMREALAELIVDRDAAERIVILLAGHFVKSERGTWFLGTDARAPDLASADGMGLPLSTVLEIASGAPGGAIVLLGSDQARITLGTGLAPGIGGLDIPQGVTVLSGDAEEIAAFAAEDLPKPGFSLSALATGRPDLDARGYLGALSSFLPMPATEAGEADTTSAERAFWQVTRGMGTVASYEAYLARYPSGLFAPTARAEIARLKAEPARLAEEVENALRLTRDQRREVQRNLSLMGFDPRGIDGIFGRGSRTAITNWQKANGFDATGFLTRDQILQLSAQAGKKAAELEAEAAARRAEEERQDRLYWSQTGAAGDEAGLRAYLKRYPDGLFADLAQDRLDVIEENRRQTSAAQERAAWDRAVATNTVAGYRDYLAAFPDGAFADEAREQIAALIEEQSGASEREKAAAAEAALNLPAVAKNMAELRLDQLGLKPGRVDGVFDDDTRRAIRRFQRSRGLNATGYLDQETVVQLLSGGIIRFGD